MRDKLISGNAYWVQVDGETWLAELRGNDFHISEDRWLHKSSSDISEIVHIPFPIGWNEEIF